MLATLKTIFYVPLYNGLIFLIGVLPGHSVGIAVILFTCLIKLILSPLSHKAAKFQLEMKMHEGELNRIKEQFKNDKQAQGKAVLDFYREKNINPFAGILPLFIQIPIIIALYYVFYGGGLPVIDTALLYSFVPVPVPDMHIFGINILQKSLLLAILAGVAQFLQAHFAMPPAPPKTDTPSLGNDLARGMHMQMKYFLPIFMGFIAYAVNGAVALYFITSSLFTIAQELVVRRSLKKGHPTHQNSL
ncbi:MAG: YidC/Oxa1 family membrane protein insertase [bacterium]|nr:YidC/Oxa1 family membrane protein insertase [bacterium]